MTMIAEYDWQSDTFTHPTDLAAWRAAVAEIAAKALQAAVRDLDTCRW